MREEHRASWARTATALVALTVIGAACSSSSDSSSSLPGEPRPTLGLTAAESTAIEPPTAPAPESSAPAPETTVALTPVTQAPPPAASVEPATSVTTDASVTPETIVYSADEEVEDTEPDATFEPGYTIDTAPHSSTPVSDQSQLPFLPIGIASGPATKRIQVRLLELGFWLVAADGEYGLTTRQAIIAFQKYTAVPRTGEVDTITAQALTDAKFRATATATDSTLVEVDKDRQLLFLVQDGRTSWAFNTSTGSGKPYVAMNQKIAGKIERGDAITPSGLFKVNREKAEGWWDGDLGKIYRPKYFKGGIAIHGMNSVPARPVSHGCVRLSLPAMDFIWANDLMPKGMVVWVHGTP